MPKFRLRDYENGTMARHRSRKEARKFAAQIRPGQTWWTIRYNGGSPGAQEFTLDEWHFKKDFLGFWRSGHMGAETAWLNYGPLFPERPSTEIFTDLEWRSLPDCSGPEREKAVRDLQARLGRQFGSVARRPLVGV